MMIAKKEKDRIRVPGFATAHSHAFQRGLRGRTQRKEAVPGSFWSWREGMYRMAERLDPDSIYAISRFAFAELALAGVTAVGEFHYVHHQANGTPYAERTLLADAVIRAARDVGLRITLLRVLYHRNGFHQVAQGAQRRFCDADVDRALDDVSDLMKKYALDHGVKVGVAPHSVRAVSRDWIVAAHRLAAAKQLPFHMHVAEQPREVEECKTEYGKTPVAMLAEAGVVNSSFVAVHATHLDDADIRLLGGARAFVCVCRTTERDLGDGLCRSGELLRAGARFCNGIDSHAITDPFEEVRAVELDDRLRTVSRHAVCDATELLRVGTRNGYEAIGMAGTEEDAVWLAAGDPALAGADERALDDAVVFGAGPRAVREVKVGNRVIVKDGVLADYEEIRAAYERALARVFS
jgi:formiminoglutamate deiminase